MQAIILAAGQGNRLADFNPDGRPKCLLEFGSKSLLARQLDNLFRLGVRQVILVVGFEADLILEHVATLDSRPEVAYAYNPAYTSGSMLSLLAAQDVLRGDEPVLVLGAHVLFHPKILQVLVESVHQNCYLIDRDFVPGDGAVKIALKDGHMVEFRKQLKDGLEYDTLGVSVGYFKFSGAMAKEIADTCAAYRSDGLLDAPHEEVLRDVLLKHPDQFACEDVSGLPWLEAGFPGDIERAIKDILPAIRNDIPDF